MRRMLLAAAVLFTTCFVFSSDAFAQRPTTYSGYLLNRVGHSTHHSGHHGYHSGHHHGSRYSSHYRGLYGHGHGHSYGTRGRGYWHDTSHFDYYPGGFQRHGNHYHYVPGHYHFHRDGHWHRR